MPSKKKKYNARFPAGRIKKIMQSDEEIGKVAQAVPVIIFSQIKIPRTLELFVESLLNKTVKITNSRNAKTLSTSHMKQCIMSEQRFDFLRELVKNIPDISVAEEAASYNEDEGESSTELQYPDSDTPYDLSLPSTSSMRATRTSTQIMTATSKASFAGDATPRNGGDLYHSSHQNGASPRTPHLKRSRSVIKHTTTDMQREPLAMAMPTNRFQQQHQHQRIDCNSSSSNNSDSSSHSVPKKSMLLDNLPHSHTTAIAAAAPIVSFDFFNKPIVKIDYSNLPVNKIAAAGFDALSARHTPATPHSAPADMTACTRGSASSESSTFNFNEAPIISIDLSNIVAATAATDMGSAACQAGIAGNTAVATISIGTIPPTHSSPKPATTTAAATLIDKTALAAVPTTKGFTNSNPAKNATKNSAATAVMSKTTCVKKHSLFELDEDYDNI